MKKSTKILLCLSAVLIAFGTLLAVGSFAFGVDPVDAFQSGMLDFTIRQKRTSEFSLDGRYSIPANELAELSIEWLDGMIVIEVYDGSEIILQENGSSSLDESNALMYTKENGTLKISSAPSPNGLSLSNIGQGSKDLHIYLPKNVEWEKLQIDAQNADISINGINFLNLKVDGMDGDLSLSELKLDDLVLNSIEGNLTVKGSQIEKINVDTISGGMNASLIHCPQSMRFDTVSGDAKLYLPDNSEFTVQMDTISGILDSDFVGTYSEEYFTVGAGAAQFKMDTISGSVQIFKIEGE